MFGHVSASTLGKIVQQIHSIFQIEIITYLFKAQYGNCSTRYHKADTNNEKEMQDFVFERTFWKPPIRYLQYNKLSK